MLKIKDEMAEYITEYDTSETFCDERLEYFKTIVDDLLANGCGCDENCKLCIIKYFERIVENE